jgi:hypothetical protein
MKPVDSGQGSVSRKARSVRPADQEQVLHVLVQAARGNGTVYCHACERDWPVQEIRVLWGEQAGHWDLHCADPECSGNGQRLALSSG